MIDFATRELIAERLALALANAFGGEGHVYPTTDGSATLRIHNPRLNPLPGATNTYAVIVTVTATKATGESISLDYTFTCQSVIDLAIDAGHIPSDEPADK